MNLKDELEDIFQGIVDDMRDPLYRQQAIATTYDIVAEITDHDGEVLRALADCGLIDVTAGEIALALSGTHRWRMTDAEIRLLESMIEACDSANLN
jgi:hypothetical protein